MASESKLQPPDTVEATVSLGAVRALQHSCCSAAETDSPERETLLDLISQVEEAKIRINECLSMAIDQQSRQASVGSESTEPSAGQKKARTDSATLADES